MKIIGIIPARMGSSRFPGKPLKLIKGKPMIQRVIENCEKSKLLSEVITATCDKEIYDFVKSKNKHVVMTSKKHIRASDRVCEALKKIEKKKQKKFDIVVMIQGDEPMIKGKMIDSAVKPMLKDKRINVVNLMGPIRSNRDLLSVNTIKVISNKKGDAIYFSRSPIPHQKKFKKNQYFKQICVIPFKRNFLFKYSKWNETKLEKKESIDMLRVLENNFNVRLVKTLTMTQAVDDISDLKLVEKLL